MRASRLLSLLLLLQTRGRMTARELADELEVSIRTVYRDVESLSSAGVPVYADRGPDGGYQLLDGYRTRLTGLTTDEAESLFLTGMPGPAAELGLGAVLAGAELKLLAALPPDLRTRAGRIRERFHLDAPGWFRLPEPAPHLATIADAVWNQRRVRARYLRWAQPREITRTLDPLGVVLKAGSWYLVARCDEEIRTYRVSRVLELEVLDDAFTWPAEFDLTAFWQSWSERFETGVYTGKAVIRFSPEAWRRLPHLVLPATARAAEENAGPPGHDGWVQTVIPIESIKHAHVEVLKFGAEVEVLEPPELRERVMESARGLVRLYEAGPPGRDG
jgi:predicted DNA-binding transcriptional regulator YafY